MGRRKVILHVGQSKAGSTSIQNYLEVQRESLLESGFLFPKSVFLRQNPFDSTRTPGHLKFLQGLNSGELHDFEKELSNEPESTLILSVESLFSDQTNKVLDKVANYFNGWDVHIIVVLREQAAWLRSRYVENTMSGFSSRYGRFSTFVTEMMERGTLNYNERIEFLRQRLNAQSVKAINFDSSEQSLIPRLLSAIEVPVTDPDKASEVHDNRREKPIFLVEAKRRLNIFAKELERDARLRLEHELRERCKVMLSAGAPCNSIAELNLPLDINERRKIERENSLLFQSGMIDLPLELEASTQTLPRCIEPNIEAAVDDLFGYGLDIVSSFDEARTKRSIAPAAMLDWLSEVPVDWRETLFKGVVSVHIGSPGSAVLAACKESRLVRLFIEGGIEAIEIARKLEALPLASPVVVIVVQSLENETIQSLMKKYSFPGPDLVTMRKVNDSPLAYSVRKEFALGSLVRPSSDNAVSTLYIRKLF